MAMNTKPTTCTACGASWARDPALEVPCPTCRAPVGSPCTRPSGHGCDCHPARDGAALRAGHLTRCPAAHPTAANNFTRRAPHVPVQSSLFA